MDGKARGRGVFIVEGMGLGMHFPPMWDEIPTYEAY